MSERRRIFLYGDSLVLAGLGASLQHEARFEVTGLSLPLPGPAQLAALAPDVVVFDMEGAHPDAAFALLDSVPGLLVLGVSPDGNVVRLWSGRQYGGLSTRDLTALIDHVVSAEAADGTHPRAPEQEVSGSRDDAARAAAHGTQ